MWPTLLVGYHNGLYGYVCMCVRVGMHVCVFMCVCMFVHAVCVCVRVINILYLISSLAKEQVCNIGIVPVQSGPCSIAVAMQPQGIKQEQHSVQE